MLQQTFPPFLVAVDRKRNRVFVLAQPDLCALKTDNIWRTILPLSDEEIPSFELITDLAQAQSYVKEARNALWSKS